MQTFHEEDILGKAYDGRLMKRLLKYLRPYRKHVIGSIFLNVAIAALGPLRPYLTKVAIDNHIVKGDPHGLVGIILLLFATVVAQGAIQYAMAYFTQWIGQRTIFDLRMEIFEHLQRLSLRFFDRNPIGRLITRVTNDVEVLNELFSSGIVMVFSDLFIIVWILVFMFVMNWALALVTLSVLPFLIWGTFLFRKKAREAYRQVRIQVARMNVFMQEHITGMNVIQIFNQEEKTFRKFDGINAAHRDAYVRSIFYYAIFYPGVELVSAVAIGLIIWYGGAQALDGILTVGILISFIQYTEMFFRPVRDLSEKYNIMQTAMASSERIFKLLDDRSFVPNPSDPVTLPEVRGEIEFRNVWFAYHGEDWVLKNISFRINAGETAAFVGHTGAGKTTIINLLSRFYEIQKGQICIDGVDIRTMDKHDLRRLISVVLQDVFLFSGDIKGNINLGDERIGLGKVEEAARLVGADRFIQRLPKMYDEPVKERGSTLSVGQKQLIAFARALSYDPKILILDEATSSVDTETEILIQAAIKTLLEGRTSIVIAHRLSTIQNADKIVVIHKGEIREAGTHQELLTLGGIYYKLYQLQYKDQEIRQASAAAGHVSYMSSR
ncbi:MAG TPA: ABC transporter ATP-binding protein [Bacteroidota bacterium]